MMACAVDNGEATRDLEPTLVNLIHSAEDYHALIEAATAQNRHVVIKHYASWCRICKAMAPKYARVAKDWPTIEFHEILFDDNKELLKSLGITTLPFMEVVAGRKGKIDSFECGPRKMRLLQSKLEDT